MADSGTPVVAAVDVGSSGVRAFAYTADYEILRTAVRPVRTAVGADGASTHDWAEVLDATRGALAELAADRSLDVRAVAMSGTASSLAASVVTDGGERSVREILLYSDTRAAGSDGGVDASARYARTLCPDHISYWPAKLRWLIGDALVPPGARLEFAGAKDYLFEALTGRFWVDPMTAAATGVFDSAAWAWDAESLDALGLVGAQFPAIRDATDSAPLTDAAAALTGLPSATPVVLGGMDGPLAQLGAGGFAEGVATCTVGTSVAYRAGSAARVADPEQRVWCYPVTRDFWVIGGAGSNGGNVVAWLADTIGRPDDVGPIVADALALPSDPELVFLPYFNGERAPLWRDDIRAAIVGLSAHHGAGDIARAALDGIGAAAIELADAVTSCAGPAREVRLTGGFLRQGGWAQLVTDALGVATTVPQPEEATATGAAVIAWLGLGAARPVPPGPSGSTDRREPDAQTHAVLAAKAATAVRMREGLFGR